MPDRGPEIALRGTVASRGLALGPIALLGLAAGIRRRAGSPGEEESALRAALAQAAEELATVIETGDEMAGEILSFQLALIEDEDLLAPVFAAIAGGTAADAAWQAKLDLEIADYAAGEDEYFRARAADLTDLRDRVVAALSGGGHAEVLAEGAILAAEDLTPSRFLETDWRRYGGVALKAGSAASHVAMLARARGVPLLIGLGEAFARLEAGAPAVLDAEQGLLLLRPASASRKAARQRLEQAEARHRLEAEFLPRPAVTAAGQRVQALINVDDPALLDRLDVAHCDGIGLARSEFLFRADRPLPDEEAQFQVYRRILAWAAGRPVTIRTLDAGGDKPIPGLTPDGESNPFLGLRGLRLSLARPEVFAVQLRALARAAPLGNLKVMVPMVTRPQELATARALFEQAVADCRAAGKAAALPPLGMMVEVPAAALTAGDFPADFYSIGSNDLVQYVTASGRDNNSVADLYDPANPAVLELIARTVAAGRARGVEVSLCGDMASDPALVPLLLERGLHVLSVAPGRLAAVKAAVAAWRPHG